MYIYEAVNKYQHCGRYFIPSIRQDELYCDLPNEDGKRPSITRI